MNTENQNIETNPNVDVNQNMELNQTVELGQNMNISPEINNATRENNTKKSSSRAVVVLIIVCLLIAAGVAVYFFKDSLFNTKNPTNNTTNTTTTNTTPVELKASYRLNGNGLNDFDLVFLQLENNGKNKIYSPLSIKYALEMLAEGADGNTKTQLDAVIGDYIARKYTNSKNMSFANAMFIRDTYKGSVKSDYTELLQDKYNADVKYDSFSSPKTINDWVKEKTLGIIPKLVDDVSDLDYALVNALAIDMEWKNEIQNNKKDYNVALKHEKVISTGYWNDDKREKKEFYIPALYGEPYSRIQFEGTNYDTPVSQLAAVANKYDIINELGEENIRKTVLDEYAKYVEEYGNDELFNIDNYIIELKSNYNHLSSSTDFNFYDDDEIKVFAKDLKTYDGVTLQYVGIMPKVQKLEDFIKEASSSSINTIINNLKIVSLDSFEDGYLTYVHGKIPFFDYKYDLDLTNDLKSLGIKDVFDMTKSNLSNLSTRSSYIDTALHTANIKFSNEGIKAAAATMLGGKGGTANPHFEYSFEIPIKEIDLAFDRPFMYIIRDKSTGEVWFAGSVYEPLEYNESLNGF